MEKCALRVGDVVQLNPEYHPDVFGCAFMVVTKPKPWGAHGYCHSLKGPENVVHVRPRFKDMKFVGRATWIQIP